jgi:hypothetical protein
MELEKRIKGYLVIAFIAITSFAMAACGGDDGGGGGDGDGNGDGLVNGPDIVGEANYYYDSIEGCDAAEAWISNDGNETAGQFTVSKYLSTDTVCDTGDHLLDTLDIPDLAPGVEWMFHNYYYGDGIASEAPGPGTYYLCLIVDVQNTVSETNEDNNTACDDASPINVP